VVILDLKMPSMNGITTLQRIRQADPVLPIVILTDHDDLRSALAGIKEGIADLITKPIDIERLHCRPQSESRDPAHRCCEPTITDLMTPLEQYPASSRTSRWSRRCRPSPDSSPVTDRQPPER
jgi:DNA-binding response OmpR family regulator